MASGLREKALKLVQNLPRLTLGNVRTLPESIKKKKSRRRSRGEGKYHGHGSRGQRKRLNLPRLGFEGNNTPFYLQIPKEPYYKRPELQRQYVPVSLVQLQRMVDLGRINPAEPVDISSICNTNIINVHWELKQYGIHLTDEGLDLFRAKLNIEVQQADELSIAAVEKHGGVITTRYFDPHSLHAACNPAKFFARGVPIPVAKLPPQNLMQYYTDPLKRGYLANATLIKDARIKLAQKYGYTVKEYENEEEKEMLLLKKDPQQIFFGLSPGWIVNIKDRVILKPKDSLHKEFYGLD